MLVPQQLASQGVIFLIFNKMKKQTVVPGGLLKSKRSSHSWHFKRGTLLGSWQGTFGGRLLQSDMESSRKIYGPPGKGYVNRQGETAGKKSAKAVRDKHLTFSCPAQERRARRAHRLGMQSKWWLSRENSFSCSTQQ